MHPPSPLSLRSDVLTLDTILLPLVLVACKIIVAPILSELFVNIFGVSGDLALYAFIYGAIPTACVTPPHPLMATLRYVSVHPTLIAVLCAHDACRG